ncbi:LacI family DNA-binding transcriptional regulator [Virgibacillus soli]|uniref:LacI family DNA-binding transcriptional regulator n=1 Tax=Paracerasibacillus soli TaxID=480284 RepID=A0ABU5CV96_9BACI|nr:LacI family DNA-binding transcriptional regulator [Virgibacillus soli]MDY0409328.1 LacI family DNA-binding transcriptional regulator [Virgibacillus soli]
MKLTIKDIAKMAGVSPGTVSKVINHTGNISQKTIKRVRKVIEETGYQPTFSAKSLATKKSNLIGLIYAGNINAELNHPFFNDVVNVFKNAIGNLGYDILVFSNNKFSKDKQDYLARCRHFQLDGCLIIAGDQIEEATTELDQSNVPCVGVDIILNGPNSSYVTTDNNKVSEAVVTHLYLNRIKEVAFIGGPEDSVISNLRKESFIKNINLFGMLTKDDWLQHGDYFEESGYQAMNRILEKSPLPQAVFAISDMMALGALRALKEKGISVPEEIKIIGCDDIEACRYSNPSLATVKQDKEKIGQLAAHMLHDLINGDVQPTSVLVDPELVIRESCFIDMGGTLTNR